MKKVIVQPHGNHTNVRGLMGKTVEAIMPNGRGGINIRFKGKGGREPFLEVSTGWFTNGRNERYFLGDSEVKCDANHTR